MEALQYCTMYDFRCSSFQSQESRLSVPLTGPPPGSSSNTASTCFRAAYTSCSNSAPIHHSQKFTYPSASHQHICSSGFSSGRPSTTSTTTVNNNTTIIMDLNNSTDQMIDSNLEPTPRNRCNTWPLRPIEPPSNHDSESNHATDGVIKEEEPEDFDNHDEDDLMNQTNLGGQDHLGISNQLGINNGSELGSQGDLNAKKQSARKNAWGNLSYADLITKAIQSTAEKRLTLAQIYDWMVQNVSYFRDKGDSNSSAGWKNSIRHNLSLHSRFMRIQNEGAGKSSWWVINPDAKPGKAPRRPRGGSMDSKSMNMKATRDRAMKKVRELKNKGLLNKDGTISPVSPANEFTLSPGDGGYRDRASSFASTVSHGRLSPDPLMEHNKLSPWGSEGYLVDSEYPMDSVPVGKLPDDFDLMGLKFSDGGFMNALEDISEPGYMETSVPSSNMPGMNSMFQQGKPYSTYATNEAGSSSFNPPPPYPNEQQNQQYNKQTINSQTTSLYKDPMMNPYSTSGNNGNNNSLSPNMVQRQYMGGYNGNGVLPNQNITTASQQQRLSPAQMTQAQPQPQPQRVIPNSIRAALGNPSVQAPQRPIQISQSLKASAPILTQQLLDYQPPTQQQQQQQQQQQMYNNQNRNMSQPRSGGPGMNYNPTYQQMGDSFMYGNGPTGAGEGNAQQSQQQMEFPGDFDFDNMPELLSCDVDEIIEQEMKLDGGQIDFAGFNDYSSQNQQQNSGSQSGIGLS